MTDLEYWRRRLCRVTDRVLITGDLPQDEGSAMALLEEWRSAGVTHILDVRAEGDAPSLLLRHAPAMRYMRVPTEDEGRQQPDAWFDAGVAYSLTALSKPDTTLLIHCAMGINRGPSMAFRILLELGWQPITALEAIRHARPIADVGYAGDALDHFHRVHDIETGVRDEERGIIEAWLRGYL